MFNTIFDSSLNIHFFKKIFIPLSISINMFNLNNKNFLILSNTTSNKIYILIPSFFKIFFFNNFIYLHSTSLNFNITKILFTFLSYFLNTLFVLRNTTAKTIFIKGVGLRINFNDSNTNILKLKLGYSHLIYLLVPQTLKILLFKKKLLVYSYTRVSLGNFCSVIQKFKPLNVFTGKGLYIKRKKVFLKAYIKKI